MKFLCDLELNYCKVALLRGCITVWLHYCMVTLPYGHITVWAHYCMVTLLYGHISLILLIYCCRNGTDVTLSYTNHTVASRTSLLLTILKMSVTIDGGGQLIWRNANRFFQSSTRHTTLTCFQ